MEAHAEEQGSGSRELRADCLDPDKGEEKKIRLFGFEFDPYDQANIHKDGAEEIEAGETGEKNSAEDKKYVCQFCCKEFPNSQALGGHQNAHKERMKRKRLELQTRRAGINFYLQPLIKSHCSGFDFSVPQWFDPSRSAHSFLLFEQSNGSFKTIDQNLFAGSHFTAKPPSLASQGISMIPAAGSWPVNTDSSSWLMRPKQAHQELDLQLGLAVKSTVCTISSSRNGF